MPNEIKEVVDELNKAFEDFKTEMSDELKDLKDSRDMDPLTKDKFDKIVARIDDLEKLKAQLDAIERAVASFNRMGVGKDDDFERVYQNVGEQIIDAVIASDPTKQGSSEAIQAAQRLAKVREIAAERKKKIKGAATGASETIPSDGGYLIQQDYGGMLDQGTIATGLLSSRCFNVPISANANGLRANVIDETSRANGSRYGGIQVYFGAEAATVTATKPKFRKIDMSLEKIFGAMYLTEELLQDATALTAMINRWFPQEFGFKLDDQIINGVGGGTFQGILTSKALVSQGKEQGQVAATIVFENIAKMYSRLLDSSETGAVWVANREILPQILTMSLAVGTGGVPVYLPANDAAGRPMSTLFGKPILFIEQAAALGTKGDLMLIDFGEYMIINKGGIQTDLSIHVQFLYGETVIRWMYRANGQPLRNSALTPYKGSATRSPFVALATRS